MRYVGIRPIDFYLIFFPAFSNRPCSYRRCPASSPAYGRREVLVTPVGFLRFLNFPSKFCCVIRKLPAIPHSTAFLLATAQATTGFLHLSLFPLLFALYLTCGWRDTISINFTPPSPQKSLFPPCCLLVKSGFCRAQAVPRSAECLFPNKSVPDLILVGPLRSVCSMDTLAKPLLLLRFRLALFCTKLVFCGCGVDFMFVYPFGPFFLNLFRPFSWPPFCALFRFSFLRGVRRFTGQPVPLFRRSSYVFLATHPSP